MQLHHQSLISDEQDDGNIAAGLFNADSFLDLAVANGNDNDVSIRLGNGDGTFNSTAPDVVVGDEPGYVAVGNFNQKHKPIQFSLFF